MRTVGGWLLAITVLAGLPTPTARSEDAAFTLVGVVRPPAGTSLEHGILTIRGRRQPDKLPLGMPNWVEEGTEFTLEADGTFQAAPGPKGPYVIELLAWAGGVVCSAQKIVRPEAARRIEITLTPVDAHRTGTALPIRVLDASGAVVPTVTLETITRESHGRSQTFRTGQSGLSILRSERPIEGALVHVVSAHDAAGAALPLGSAVAEGDVRTGVTVRLAPQRALDGVVRSTSGAPLAGITLLAHRDIAPSVQEAFDLGPPGTYEALAEDAEATSDGQGHFSFAGLDAGPYVIEVRDVPEDHVAPALVPVAADAASADIRVTAKVRPTLTVVDADGAPVSDARVRIVRQDARIDGGLQLHLATDATGRVATTPLDPAKHFHVRVEAPGMAMMPWVRDGWSPSDTRVRLAPAFAIQGVVRSADGTPRRDASIYIRPAGDDTSLPPAWGWIRIADGFVQGALSEVDGTFQVSGLPAGTYELQAIYVDDDTGAVRRGAVVRAQTGDGPLELTIQP